MKTHPAPKHPPPRARPRQRNRLFVAPGSRSPVLSSVRVTPSLSTVTYGASVCCLPREAGSAHISGLRFLPLSLPAAQAPHSGNFRAQFGKLAESVWKGARGWGGGDRRNPTPTSLYSGAKSPSPGKTAFQGPASLGPGPRASATRPLSPGLGAVPWRRPLSPPLPLNR